MSLKESLADDWNGSCRLPGETLVMRIEKVAYSMGHINEYAKGTLVMTNYQIFFEPYVESRITVSTHTHQHIHTHESIHS